MAAIVQVYLKNNSFSEEYAIEKHEGQDSPENIRYEWEDEFRINGDFTKVEIVRNGNYVLSGEKGDGTLFSHTIEDMMIFEFHAAEGITPIAFSEKAVDVYELKEDASRLKVILNDEEVVENPIPGIYIIASRFPKELI